MAPIRLYAYLAYFLVFLSWGFCSAHRPVLTFKDEPVADKPVVLASKKDLKEYGHGEMVVVAALGFVQVGLVVLSLVLVVVRVLGLV